MPSPEPEPRAMDGVLLLHGGLWEDMDARRFWVLPGVVDGLAGRGFRIVAPDRLPRAESWAEETAHIAGLLPDRPVTVVAGSNGCSVAVRLAVDHPGHVARLVLAWPATAGDPLVDERTRQDLAKLGASPGTVASLLSGQTLRGVSDVELGGLALPVAVVPSAPANPFHQRWTVDALLERIPAAVELPGCPEPPRPDFPRSLESFVTSVAQFAAEPTSRS